MSVALGACSSARAAPKATANGPGTSPARLDIGGTGLIEHLMPTASSAAQRLIAPRVKKYGGVVLQLLGRKCRGDLREGAEQPARVRHSPLPRDRQGHARTLSVEQDGGVEDRDRRERPGQSNGRRLDDVDRGNGLDRLDPASQRGRGRGEHQVVLCADGGHDVLVAHREKALGLEPDDVAALRCQYGRERQTLGDQQMQVDRHRDAPRPPEMWSQGLERFLKTVCAERGIGHPYARWQSVLQHDGSDTGGPDLQSDSRHHQSLAICRQRAG